MSISHEIIEIGRTKNTSHGHLGTEKERNTQHTGHLWLLYKSTWAPPAANISNVLPNEQRPTRAPLARKEKKLLSVHFGAGHRFHLENERRDRQRHLLGPLIPNLMSTGRDNASRLEPRSLKWFLTEHCVSGRIFSAHFHLRNKENSNCIFTNNDHINQVNSLNAINFKWIETWQHFLFNEYAN